MEGILEKEIIKTIKLNPIKVIRQSRHNPYMRGLVMKRELTTREACHIYRDIFLFNLDLAISECFDKEEKTEFYKDITEELNLYIKGEASWNALCDITGCYADDDDTPSIAAHLKLAEYLQKREII